MPKLVTFKDKPVKRKDRLASGALRLIFYAPNPGTPGHVQVVSQAAWTRFGKERYYKPNDMPDVRALARQ